MNALRLLAALLLALPALTGCANEREELEREHAELIQQRDYLGSQLQNTPMSHDWHNHPDTQTIFRARGDIEQRVREIDHELGR